MRNGKAGVTTRDLSLPFRIRHSAFRIGAAAVLGGCNPATTRPPFSPFPEAKTVLVDTRPDRITTEIQQWLAADSVPVARVSARDGYLETVWHDGVKIRCWADPDTPGRARLTVEAVYRPNYDPSRIPRDLEQAVPRGHPGHALAERLLEAMRAKFPVQ